MGWRYAVRWFARRGRTWLTVGAALLATWLAWRDHRPGWTILVGVATVSLAVGTLVIDYTDAHPDRAEQLAARRQAEVDAIVARYERESAADRVP